MLSVHQIGWGRYREYEGPYFRGLRAAQFRLPTNPNSQERLIAVVTAPEGGNYSAVNGYDRMIMSVGLPQAGEARQFGVSDLLGAVEKEASGLLDCLAPLLGKEYTFKPNPAGKWRFHFSDGRQVRSLGEQQRLFLLRSKGRVGSWDQESRRRATRWAAGLASVFQEPQAQRIQLAWTAAHMHRYVRRRVQNILADAPCTPLGEAVVASVTAFSVNSPTRAEKHLLRAMDNTTSIFTERGLVEVLRELTFGPKVSIYPGRYDAMRPVLEKLYGVELPDFSRELRNRTLSFPTPKSVQRALLALGYDLGPAKDDGVFGRMSRAALREFEEENGAPTIHRDGLPDAWSDQALEEALEGIGADFR